MLTGTNYKEMDFGENIPHETNEDQIDSEEFSPTHTSDENSEEPKVGVEFEDSEIAYDFYCRYAHKIGFSVRKRQVKKINEVIRRRTFCCSRQGKRANDKRRVNATYRRAETRIDCKAQMTCKRQKNGKFIIVSFNATHNHDLVESPAKHMLKSKRTITAAQKAQAEDAEKSGLSNKATIDLMSRQAGGRAYLGFLDVDYRNYVNAKKRTQMQKGDAGAMLEYFQKMKSMDPSFFYAIQLDQDDLITNIFWTDSKSMVDYKNFGDVVCFDTTYKTNEYGRPFAPFVGVNHHKQTIIFGGVLLYDETEESFQWAFETFLEAMSGKPPQTILTDQAQAMANAIEVVFPNTRHRLCVWHIYQNAAKHLSHVFNASKQFTKDFSACVYDYEEEDEWICAWNTMLQEYGLVGNRWLENIYEERAKWAMVYGRHMFTADMKSTQRSESLNSVLKKYLNSDYNLLQFFEQYDRLLEDRRYKELTAEFKMKQSKLVLLADVAMLRDAVRLYTPEAFKLFEFEYMKVWDCTIEKAGKFENITDYKVCYKGRDHTVKFDGETNLVQCSCMKFTFVGILCSHALKVLDKKNIKKLPPYYVMKRWSKEAKDTEVRDYRKEVSEENPQESMGKRYRNLCHEFREITTIASEDEHMYSHTHDVLSKLLKDLQQMKKQSCSGNLDSNSNTIANQTFSDPILPPEGISKIDGCYKDQVPRGIKTKPTVGRPGKQKRLKNCLEIGNSQKPQPTTIIECSFFPENDSQSFDVGSKATKKKRKTSKKQQKTTTKTSVATEPTEIEDTTRQEVYESMTTNFSHYDYSDKMNFFESQVPPGYIVTNSGSRVSNDPTLSGGQISFTQLLQRSMDNSRTHQ